MVLEGVTTNVTRLSPFVDIGVPPDGLVHIQEVSYRWTNDLNEVVGVSEPLAASTTKRIALDGSTANCAETRVRPAKSGHSTIWGNLAPMPNSQAIAAPEPQGQTDYPLQPLEIL
jgi:hypothetical protein